MGGGGCGQEVSDDRRKGQKMDLWGSQFSFPDPQTLSLQHPVSLWPEGAGEEEWGPRPRKAGQLPPPTSAHCFRPDHRFLKRIFFPRGKQAERDGDAFSAERWVGSCPGGLRPAYQP